MTARLRIGTRGSRLALWQARDVAARLAAAHADLASEIVVIRTSGDAGAGAATPEPGGVKRLFVKEIEEALLEGRIDLAVHSSKDLPAHLPAGLAIGAALPRDDPRDALVLPGGAAAADRGEAVRLLGPAPRIGTSSLRRAAQIAAAFPGATFEAVRGNVDTRVRRLDEGACTALVLAAAGLRRLGLADRISWLLPFDICLPAPGQGIVAVELREDDAAVRALVGAIGDREAEAALAAERAVVAALGSGCQMPLGALAESDGAELRARGVVLSLDGARAARAEARGPIADPTGVGSRLAQALLAAGAASLLAGARAAGAR